MAYITNGVLLRAASDQYVGKHVDVFLKPPEHVIYGTLGSIGLRVS